MLNILLADDDKDDCFFFEKALDSLPFSIHLDIVHDGERLMKYLLENANKQPDIIFLDLNMPRKNGSECLAEIKSDKKMKRIPVVIYSTSLNESVADELYKNGAHYYIRKCDFLELKKILCHILKLFHKKKFDRPRRNEFIFDMVEV